MAGSKRNKSDPTCVMLAKAVERFRLLVSERKLKPDQDIFVEPLGVKEALGNPAPYVDFALQRGEERLLEASFDGARGQAFTSFPCRWRGTLGGLLSLDLATDRERAIMTAGMNAVCRKTGIVGGTIHCKDKSPEECGGEMAFSLKNRFGMGTVVGVVGYQPAILKHLAAIFSPAMVRVVDLNPENIGRVIDGVVVWDGEKEFRRFANEVSVALATGSTIVNGTSDGICSTFQQLRKPVIFFGTSIAGPAALLGLERLCPLAS